MQIPASETKLLKTGDVSLQHKNKVTLEDKLAFTPAEVAGMFGRHYTWTYRQLYRGNMHALEGSERLLIPRSEIERFLSKTVAFSERVPRAKDTRGPRRSKASGNRE